MIAEVGPSATSSVTTTRTVACAGSRRPKLIDRRVREEWAAAGSTTVYDRALAEARRILETHVPEPLPAAVAAKLKEIIRAAEEELGVG